MRRLILLIKRGGAIAGLLSLASCVSPASTSTDAAAKQVVVSESLVVLSLDPKPVQKDAVDTSQPLMYGHPILARVEVSDQNVIRETMALLKQGFAAQGVQGSRCWLPRHGVIHTTAEGVTEYVICFQCRWYSAYGLSASGGRSTTSVVAKRMLDRLLQRARDRQSR